MRDDRPTVVILNWRDSRHPEGGGCELYVEELAAGLVRRGHRVTLVCARYPGSAARERRPAGIDVVRIGGRLTVYPRSALAYLAGRLGRPEVIIEVHNGMPFLARLWARRARVIVLVHHVHREQWRVVMPAPLARIGWWIESRLAPRVNRRTQYVAVSETTRRELTALGIPADHIEVVPNGTPAIRRAPVARSVAPTLLVVSRLVPHKRIELAIDTLAALLPQFPGLRLLIVGRGWWEQPLRRHVDRRGMREHVHFTGFVSEAERTCLYGSAWISLVPSVMEGWGLVVVEAGAMGTPSVGFRDAGGVAESIRDRITGLLADDPADFAAKVGLLLRDAALRTQLGRRAADYAEWFTWDETVRGFAAVIDLPDGATKVHRVTSRAGSGLRSVVHQRRIDLLGGRLRRGVDPDTGKAGENRRDERGQRDAHPLLPRSGGAAPAITAPGVRPLHRGRYLRSRTPTPAQSPVVTAPAKTNPAATASAETTAAAGAENPRSGSSAWRSQRPGTSYRLRSGPR
ncbi:MAG TPA: glycosyltransferase family 4 protein [Jatrophihabitans sp.]|jgi:glycosyltransferase involved in cell wall biosynthesis